MIYYLSGPDEFSRSAAVQRLLKSALPPDTADLNTTYLGGAEATPDAVRFASEAAPFLADRRAVVVTGAFTRPARPGGGRRKEPEGTSGLVDYLARVPANTLLILVELEVPPKGGALAKALETAGARQQFFPVLAGMPLVRWIKDRVKGAGAQITDEAADLLAAYAGGDLRAVANEVDKLATYAGPGQTIDAGDVETLVSQASDVSIFDCVDAIGQGDRGRALTALHTLIEHGERPERVLVLAGRQVRLLLQARHLAQQGEPPDAIGRALGIPPFPLRKVLDQMRLFELAQLEAMLRRVLEADVHLKTGEMEARFALELLIAELSAHARPRSSRAVSARPNGQTWQRSGRERSSPSPTGRGGRG